MKPSSVTKVPSEIRTTMPSTSENGDSNIKTKKASPTPKDESNKDLGIEDDSSCIDSIDSDSVSEKSVKPFCPPTVTQIVNALSTVGTFGGLALIITGGMGITLNKPVDNTMENIAMVLSGGALLVGSWVGNVAYANHQPA